MRRLWIMLSLIIFVLSCANTAGEESPPADHPYFPSAVIQGTGVNDKTLYVFSSNFDRRYGRGSVISVDLLKVDEGIASSKLVIGSEAVTSSAFIPSFSAGATLSKLNDQILYVTRDEISLRRIPLSPTGLITCPQSTSQLGQDCYSAPAAARLTQSNPYFVNLFENPSQELTGGAIGYLLDPIRLRPNELGKFDLLQYFEFERFTWNSTTSTAQISEKIDLGETLLKAENPSFITGTERLNTQIGALTQFGGDLYLQILQPTALLLARIALSDLETSPSAAIALPTFNLTTATETASIGALGIRNAGPNIEVITFNALPGRLVKLSMPATNNVDINGKLMLTKTKTAPTCDSPSDLKLTPDQSAIVVACGNGKIFVHDANTLDRLFRDPASGGVFGRSPTKIHFDTRITTSPFRFYTTNFSDGSLSIFDIATDAQSVLTRRGHIFQPAPHNRLGGTP